MANGILRYLGKSKNIWVDTEGKIHILRTDGTEQTYADLDNAIRGTWHILNGYLGYLTRINGEVLLIFGERQELRQFDSDLRQAIGLALGSNDQKKVDQLLDQTIARIGAVTDPYKQAASRLLRESRAQKKEKQAITISQADTALLKRLADTAQKARGIYHQRQLLLAERRDSISRLISIRKILAKMMLAFRDPEPSKETLLKFAQEFQKGKTGLWPALASMAQPFRHITISPQTKRLLKLQEYARNKQAAKYLAALTGAFLKLDAYLVQLERRSLRTIERIPKGDKG